MKNLFLDLKIHFLPMAAAILLLFPQAYGVGAQVGFLLPYSRGQEADADRIGLILMARAGYDPREAVPFWKRMNEKGGARPPQFLSTHPGPETRIREIEAHIPGAMKYCPGEMRISQRCSNVEGNVGLNPNSY